MRNQPYILKRRRHNSVRGAAILESVVGLSLLLTILVGTASMIISVQKTNIHANEINIASNAAAEQIEIMKSLTLTELIAAQNNTDITSFEAQRVIDGTLRSLKALPGETVPGKTSIQAVAGGKLLRILVTVDWESPLGPSNYSLVWTREVINASGK